MFGRSSTIFTNHRNLITALPALALYVTACALPALTFFDTNTQTLTTYSGGQALVRGALTLFSGQYAWLANPLAAIGLATLLMGRGRYRITAITAAFAALLATHTLALKGHPLPANEGGTGELQLRSLGIGFYLWEASLIALLGGAAAQHFLDDQAD